jgi:hypothetical protein
MKLKALGFEFDIALSGVENKDLHWEAKISSRHASILNQFAIAQELLHKKSLEYQLLVWLCD